MKILVVDDSPTALLWMQTILAPAGHEPVCASSGRQALDILEATDIGLVMTDLVMPELDGAQLLAEIRRRHAHLPVVVMSGVGSIEDAVHVLQLGADEFLAKPIRQDELLSCLERVLVKAKVYAEAWLFASMIDASGARPPMQRLGEIFAQYTRDESSTARAFSLEALEMLERWRGSEEAFSRLVGHAVQLAKGPVVERSDLVEALALLSHADIRDLEAPSAPSAVEAPSADAAKSLPRYESAMRLVVDRFEKLYLARLLEGTATHEEASVVSGLAPTRLAELLRRHGLADLPSSDVGFLVAP